MANTQSKGVNLTKRVQTSKGMRYCPVVLSPNGRVKPDLVTVNGRPERHSEGAVILGENYVAKGERDGDAPRFGAGLLISILTPWCQTRVSNRRYFQLPSCRRFTKWAGDFSLARLIEGVHSAVETLALVARKNSSSYNFGS